MRVLIADDHSIIRMALKHVLYEFVPQIGIVEAADGGHCLERLAAATDDKPFDLVITDLYMPGLGRQGLPRLMAAAGTVPVIVFSASERTEDMTAAFEAGVMAYLPKTTDEAILVRIIQLVLAGGRYIPPHILSRSLADSQEPARQQLSVPSSERQLTQRQYEVLVLMADGLSNAEIGLQLNLNLSTVKSHVTGILRALGVTSRTQAVLWFTRGCSTRQQVL